MGSFSKNSLLQFAVISFVFLLGLAAVLALLIGFRFAPILQFFTAAAATDTPVSPPVVEQQLRALQSLQRLLYASIAFGFLLLYTTLVFVYRRSWRTIVRQQEDLVQTNDDLRAANRELLTMARFPDENPHVMVQLSAQGEILYQNLAAISLLKRETGTIPEPWQTAVSRVIASGVAEELEFHSHSRVFSCTFVPLPSRRYVNVYGVDITDRKLAEAASRQSDLSYRTLVDTMQDGVFILQEGKMQFVNRAFVQMLGYTEAEMRQKPYLDLIAPDSRDIAANLYEHARSEEKSPPAFEVNLLHRDGSTHVPVMLKTSVITYNDAVAALGTVTDISERKQAESERTQLLAELSRLNTIIETTSDFVGMWNLNGDFLYVNPAGMAMVGRLGEDYRHLSLADFQPPPVAQRMTGSIFPLVRKYEIWSGESTLQHIDGTLIPVSQVVTLIRNEQSEAIAIGTVARDITERKQTEQRLQRAMESAQKAQRMAEEAQETAETANQAKSTFLANMSHELRTPLNAIIGYSEMLEEEAEDRDDQEIVPDLRKIRRAGKHLLEIINDILDLSKIEAGRMTLFLEHFRVLDVVNSAVTTVSPLVEKNENTLELQLSKVGVMKADKTKVRQILYNLLSNAAKFTHNGQITLTTRREDTLRESGQQGNWLVFEVADTGIGMSPTQLDELFEPFTQADESATRKYGGTGLGLAISRHFCHMMGGEIYVESEEGTGSTFAVYLPVDVQDMTGTGDEILEAELETAVSAKLPASAPHVGIVLVIDDDPIARDLIRRQLNKAGFHVFTASSGEEGLLLAEKLRPDVITLDVLMPGMDGWSVLSQFKVNPKLAQIPVVVVTMVEEQYKGFALGATDYLMKPIDRDQLINLLLKYQRRDAEDGALGHVLIVEDDAPTRELVQRTLARQGWGTTEAENGRVALDSLTENVPDVILLDLMMPEMDGFQFVEELRRQPDWDRIPVIVITAKELTPEEQNQLDGYVERIVQKGQYDSGNLLRQISDLVSVYVHDQQRAREQ